MVQSKPVEVISVCSADGEIRPLRLRMEDDRHQLLRIDIAEIVSQRAVNIYSKLIGIL